MTSLLGEKTPIVVNGDLPPQLIVVIDAEEEFDWHAQPHREQTGVTSMHSIDIAQVICEEYGIKPCYVVDYPVASQPEGYGLLKSIHQDGKCEIGAHLHPWVNPPFDESLTRNNMYPGNLAIEQETQKLTMLCDAIELAFDHQPTIYKAGRYGLGPNTLGILDSLGFEIDLSMCPPVDYSADGGPDYSRSSAHPFWFGADSQMLEIPISGAFVGWAGLASRELYNVGQSLISLKLPGVLARIKAVDRLGLSPEGFTTAEHIRLTEFLFRRGVRTFTWNFHSPSLVPGMTPYVNSKADLHNFLDLFRRYFDYFFEELSGQATTPTQLRAQFA